ncbi:hypothetical protein [Shewanella waksmanii]|uniref:hypothetical protein n=1 Tax=Shewanella waksmanii TaxID=213783 RepID=UPI00373526E4
MKRLMMQGLLIIALVGQALFTPAMAMPSYLHAASHANLDSEIAQSDIEVWQPTDTLTSHSSTNDSHCNSGASHTNAPAIDCDALCEMLNSGDCLAHCASAHGILLQAQVSLLPVAAEKPQIQYVWFIETAYLPPINRPPIAL